MTTLAPHTERDRVRELGARTRRRIIKANINKSQTRQVNARES